VSVWWIESFEELIPKRLACGRLFSFTDETKLKTGLCSLAVNRALTTPALEFYQTVTLLCKRI
jgi:hypothetical protein